MKSEEEIKKHVAYLIRSANPNDLDSQRELQIKLAELSWVLDNEK